MHHGLMACINYLRATAYMLWRVYAIARPSVRLSVCYTGGSYKNG